MAESYIGEIKLVPYNFAPIGWAVCAGQLLPISENEALFALIGTTYGGDGQSTFALPDLRGRTPSHVSQSYPLGAIYGSESVTLTLGQLPQHIHSMHVSSSAGTQSDPTGAFLGASGSRALGKTYATTVDNEMNAGAVGVAGSNLPHNNMQPYLAMNYIICLEGIFPSPN